MSTGSVAIPLLKAAPRAEQIADRLEGGPWAGMELCLMAGDVADEESLDAAIAAVAAADLPQGFALTAECPVGWPSGAFVRVDRLDAEARAGIERSARFAVAVGSPVLTIHLFVPLDPAAYLATPAADEGEVERFLRFYVEACRAVGVTPLIENVPPVLRMRTGGVYLSPIGGHWRDLRTWAARVPGLGFCLDTSHAALFRAFCAAYPTPFGLGSAEELELARYVEELGPDAEVAHVSNAEGILGEGLPYDEGELDLDPVVRRLASLVPFIVSEVNEPDHGRSPAMKAGSRRIAHVLAEVAASPSVPLPRAARRLGEDPFAWVAVLGRPDPVPALIELEERFGGARVLITGGGGSIGRSLATFLLGFRPERVTLLDGHEASLAADRRARDPAALARVAHALGDVRDGPRVGAELERARPHVVFHLAAYKHVDWAELYPDEFVDTNLHGSAAVLLAAERADVETVVVASTDKAALAASFYGRTKRLMEGLAADAAARTGAPRAAVRLVNVLGSAGSASELFLRQVRAGVPLTITDTGMLRFWITMAHTVTLVAHTALLAAEEVTLATAAAPVELTVGDLAERVWARAAGPGAPEVDLLGVRPGETMSEVLTGEGETLGPERHQGIVEVRGESWADDAARALARLPEGADRTVARPVWREAMERRALAPS